MKPTRNEKIGIAFVVGAVVIATAILVATIVGLECETTEAPNVPDAPMLLHVSHVEIVEG